MKRRAIILWNFLKRHYEGLKLTHRMVKHWVYIRTLQFVWNQIVSPLYFRYESKVIGLIEGGKVDSRKFIVPMRLTFYNSPLVQIEDRYDYSHEDSYPL